MIKNVNTYCGVWALKDYWKPIIEEEYHRFGRWVFDNNLHNNVKEPGYLNSVYKALNFLSVQEFKNVNLLNTYKKTHKIACSHFTGDEKTNTLMHAGKAGSFRDHTSEKIFCRLPIDHMELSEGGINRWQDKSY